MEYKKVCACCGKIFTAKRKNTRYCGVKCGKKEYYNTHPQYRETLIARHKAKMQDLKARGICQTCWKNPAVPGNVTCNACKKFQRIAYQKKKCGRR